jgi:ELWxxDGT repeat protein
MVWWTERASNRSEDKRFHSDFRKQNMRKERELLRAVACAVLALLPLPALGQGAIGPLGKIRSGLPPVTATTQTDSLVFYFTNHPYSGHSLSRSDGTSAGTYSIGPHDPIPLVSSRFVGTAGDLVFFLWSKDFSLWRSDGSDAGTFPVTQELRIGELFSAGGPPEILAVPERGLVFFSAGARSENPDLELWATDGTVAGTRLVKDINPDGSSNPGSMMALGGRLYFLTTTPEGRELWRSDGTSDGTEQVRSFEELGFAGLTLARAGGALFVITGDGEGMEIWRSDGTEGGTVRVLELPGVQLDRFVEAGRRLFVVTRDASSQNRDVWSLDGTIGGSSGAVRALETVPPEIELHAIGNSVAFVLADDHGLEPWWSDGTLEGTRRAADICPGPCDSMARVIGTYGGRAVLAASDGTSGSEPWLTDGTAAGTVRLGDLCPGECGTPLVWSREHNSWLLLYDGSALWASDGIPGGARRLGTVSNLRRGFSLPGRELFFELAPSIEPFNSLWALPITAPPSPAPPAGAWITSEEMPGFRVKARITAGGAVQPVRKEPCIAQTLCLSGAVRGRPELFVRVVGPKPNGYLWPTLVRFTTSTVEVWIEQLKTGITQYYRLEGVTPDSSELNGLVDRQGFRP